MTLLCRRESLESLTFTRAKKEKRGESECLSFSRDVPLLLGGVVPRGVGVGPGVLEMKDALVRGLEFGTGLMKFRQIFPKLLKFFTER